MEISIPFANSSSVLHLLSRNAIIHANNDLKHMSKKIVISSICKKNNARSQLYEEEQLDQSICRKERQRSQGMGRRRTTIWHMSKKSNDLNYGRREQRSQAYVKEQRSQKAYEGKNGFKHISKKQSSVCREEQRLNPSRRRKK
ncbi:hypothetical protein AVEN_84648-1 [Araneus ventricosus]|uniref:Uncharacterized protein n=1 Tax=Araneus ventricosus TaxID=182803 RepID=A0A4Y2HK55_ARAVE|nr:hypothetical protein AVEN_84648-1 [Araneus ventricosus]